MYAIFLNENAGWAKLLAHRSFARTPLYGRKHRFCNDFAVELLVLAAQFYGKTQITKRRPSQATASNLQ